MFAFFRKSRTHAPRRYADDTLRVKAYRLAAANLYS